MNPGYGDACAAAQLPFLELTVGGVRVSVLAYFELITRFNLIIQMQFKRDAVFFLEALQLSLQLHWLQFSLIVTQTSLDCVHASNV